MKITLNIDSTSYDSKPKGKEGIIKNSVSKLASIKKIEPEELIEAVKDGKTFTPAQIIGTKAKDWKSQQIIVADIDNAKEAAEDPLRPDEAIEVMQRYDLMPYFMYYTFSNTADHPKYRIVLIIDEVITEAEEAAALTSKLASIFNFERSGAADTSIHNGDRFIYGSTKDCIIREDKIITSLAKLRELPTLPSKDEEKKLKESFFNSDYLQTEDTTKQEIQAFNLEAYILKTAGGDLKTSGSTTFINPCPLCGHNDDFAIDNNLFVAYGANDQKYCKPGRQHAGGTIIDYLMYKENLTLSEAFDKFKYDIQGHERPRKQQPPIMTDYKAPEPPGDPLTPDELAEAAGIKREVKPLTYTDETGADMMKVFLAKIQGRDYESIATGLSYFDRITDGGFIRGELVTLGAAPGAGKTMFAQMLLEGLVFGKDNADVLYINLEMSREQLLARSISRILWTYKQKDYKAKQILRGYDWKEEDRKEILKTIQIYAENIANHFKYVNPDTNELIDIINAMQSDTDRLKAEGRPAPIICIDYLQLITTKNKEAAEGVKVVIKQLKDFAIKNNTCVFCIIAHNRASNETGAASVTSGRDTSAIEYSGDTMLTLSYEAIENDRIISRSDCDLLEIKPNIRQKDGIVSTEYPKNKYDLRTISRLKGVALEKDLALPAACRHIMLKVVKSRFDGEGRRVTLDFDGKHATFTEVDKNKKDPWGQSEG